ncbi:MAG TPA: amidohydrolase family protein [Acidimicrobiia bacterium]
MSVIVRNAEVAGHPRPIDVRIDQGTVVAIGSALSTERADRVLDARHGALLPGLHDHHVHLRASAAAVASLPVGPPAVHSLGDLHDALASAPEGPEGWIRAVGYHESVAGPLDASVLDEVEAARPVRVQHRSGTLWILNGEALRRTGAARHDAPGIERAPGGAPTGRLWRMDAWLANVTPRVALDFAAVGRLAAARGVTGFTDADPRRTPGDVDDLIGALFDGRLPQRVHAMAPEGVGVSGLRLTRGPVKMLLDDDDLPALADFEARIAEAHRAHRNVAVHCVTRTQLVLTVAALESAGARGGDRIEHGAVIPHELIGMLHAMGVTIVTQPNFVADRGDEYISAVDPADIADLYRCRSLIDSGVPVAFGTDAPYGEADPWHTITAAVERRTRSGAHLNAEEAIDPPAAVRHFLGRGDAPAQLRRVEVGCVADLCLLKAPLAEAIATPSPDLVEATIVGGELVWPA